MIGGATIVTALGATFDSILLFLHIPKTGGTTLEKYFYVAYDTEPTEPEEGGFLNGPVYHHPGGFDKDGTERLGDLPRVLRRPDVGVVLGHFAFGVHELQERPASYTTLLRDPVERAISLASHRLMWSNGDGPLGFTVDDLEAYVLGTTDAEFDNDQVRRISGLEPEVGGCTRATLDAAKENLESFAVVGLTERFDESLLLFRRKLGWAQDDVYYLPRLVTPHRLTGSELSQAVRDLIADRNSLDRELYEWASARFDDHVRAQGPGFAKGLAAIESVREAQLREYGAY